MRKHNSNCIRVKIFIVKKNSCILTFGGNDEQIYHINMNKKILIAFVGICFSWSFSWFAIKFQMQSTVSPFISVTYRFLFAGLLLLLGLKLFNISLKISRKECKFIAISGVCNASINFILAYNSAKYIPSGVTAAIFSLTIIMGEVINAIIYRTKINKNTIISGLIGTSGLMLFLLPIINISGDKIAIITGIWLSFSGTLLATLGMISMRACAIKHNTHAMVFLTYTFICGAIISFCTGMFLGAEIKFDTSLSYVLSLAYIVVFASCIAFASLFYLNKHIGVARAGFSSLIYTVSAMFISTYFEDYNWSFVNIAGFGMIIFAIFNELHSKNKRISK